MKKHLSKIIAGFSILAVLLGVTTSMSAAAWDIRILQRDPTNTGYLNRDFPIPASSGNGLFMIDGSTSLPKIGLLGSGLNWNSGTNTWSVANVPQSSITDLSTDLAAKQPHSTVLDAFAALAVVPNKIVHMDNTGALTETDTNDYGIGIIANSTASATRSYIGAMAQPSGTTGQYIRGDGSLATFPSVGSGTVTSVGLSSTDFSVSGSPVTTSGTITANLNTVGTAGTYSGVTTDSKGRVTAGTTRSINLTPSSKTIQTVAAAANGFQVSSTRDAEVRYSASIATSVSLSGNSSGYVVLEVASTNSTTASDWKEVGRITSGQSGTLVIGLVLNQVGGGEVSATVPAGYYARLRSVNVAGTPTYTYNSGSEVLL